MKPIVDFWCDECRAWTPMVVAGHGYRGSEYVACAKCGEPFSCGDCGFEIDDTGSCQRGQQLGDPCPGSQGGPND